MSKYELEMTEKYFIQFIANRNTNLFSYKYRKLYDELYDIYCDYFFKGLDLTDDARRTQAENKIESLL